MKNHGIDWQTVLGILIPNNGSVVPGLGHLLSRLYKKGLVILSIWVGLIIAARYSPYEIGFIPLIIFWVWQSYDVTVLVRKKYPEVHFVVPLTWEELKRHRNK
jgi:hypothetical protein